MGTGTTLTRRHRAEYSRAMTAALSVDSHAHVFLRNMPLAALRRYAPDFDATPSEYLALLDAHGIRHGVLVQPSLLGYDNSYLLQALRQQPQHLRGVAMVDAATCEPALAALDAAGVTGVRLNLVGQPLHDLTQAPWPAFLARIRALDWHLEQHRTAVDLAPLIAAAAGSGCRVVTQHQHLASYGTSLEALADWVPDAVQRRRILGN